MASKKPLWKKHVAAFCASMTVSAVMTFAVLSILSPTLQSQVTTPGGSETGSNNPAESEGAGSGGQTGNSGGGGTNTGGNQGAGGGGSNEHGGEGNESGGGEHTGNSGGGTQTGGGNTGNSGGASGAETTGGGGSNTGGNSESATQTGSQNERGQSATNPRENAGHAGPSNPRNSNATQNWQWTAPRGNQTRPRIEVERNESIRPRGDLGCYTASGKWTSDRKVCAEDQRPHLQAVGVVRPTPEVVDESAERRKLDRRFIDDDAQAHRRDEALRRIKDSLFMLGTIKRSGLTASTVEMMDVTTVKLQNALRELANPESEAAWNASVNAAQRDVQAIRSAIAADELRTAASAEELVKAEEGARSVFARVNDIVAKMPAATQALDAQGVEIPQEARLAYEDAVRETLASAQECRQKRLCRHLSLAITAVEQWKEAVKKAVDQAGKPALLDEITRVFSQN